MSSNLWGLREKIGDLWHLRTKPNVDELTNEIKKINDKLNGGNDVANMKLPSGTLEFKFAPIGNVRLFTIGHDGRFYLTEGGLFKVYDDITSENTEPVETGITWDVEAYGTPVDIVVADEGITVFSNTEDKTVANIYHMADIHSTPTLVYKSVTTGTHYFTREFGIDSYFSGLHTIILAGVYGRGGDKKDLLLSKDGGLNFEVVKQTTGAGGDVNSHWHDVAIDPYHGFLWASEGDGSDNRGVHFSDDLGETWTTLTDEAQPTCIIPFPHQVVFGRDSGKPGFSVFKKPVKAEDYDNISNESFKVLKEFLPSKAGSSYYARAGFSKGSEAYVSFTLYPEHEIALVAGTGDFGNSWHFVHMGNRSAGNDRRRITLMVGMDDEYIYARSHTSVVYAKKIDWI